MHKLAILLLALTFVTTAYAAVDAIMCLERFESFGTPQPYVQFVETSEQRPDVQLEYRLGGRPLRFRRTKIEENGPLVVLRARDARSSLELEMRLTGELDPWGNENEMAAGRLRIDGRAVGPRFQCALSRY